MRILITGTSPMQCGRQNRYRYGSILDLYARALRDGGHEVDHRVWRPGDDLTAYDVALVGLVPFNSIAARHVYTVCDVIYRARSCGVGLAFAVDDHHFGTIHSGARSLAKDVPKRMFTTIKGRTDREWGETDGLPMIEACVTALAERPWPTTLVPAFRWGAHDKLDKLPTRQRVLLDPTPIQLDDYITLPRAPAGAPRQRAWMLGTLSDQREWLASLQLNWPVTYHGSKPSKAETAVKEPELVTALGGMWGSLSFPQRHAGGGWYRCRFVYTATAGAVLYADRREVEGLGGPYLVTAADIEQASDAELGRLAADQARHLFAHCPSRAELIAQLSATLQGLVTSRTIPVAGTSNAETAPAIVTTMTPQLTDSGCSDDACNADNDAGDDDACVTAAPISSTELSAALNMALRHTELLHAFVTAGADLLKEHPAVCKVCKTDAVCSIAEAARAATTLAMSATVDARHLVVAEVAG